MLQAYLDESERLLRANLPRRELERELEKSNQKLARKMAKGLVLTSYYLDLLPGALTPCIRISSPGWGGHTLVVGKEIPLARPSGEGFL